MKSLRRFGVAIVVSVLLSLHSAGEIEITQNGGSVWRPPGHR